MSGVLALALFGFAPHQAPRAAYSGPVAHLHTPFGARCTMKLVCCWGTREGAPQCRVLLPLLLFIDGKHVFTSPSNTCDLSGAAVFGVGGWRQPESQLRPATLWRPRFTVSPLHRFMRHNRSSSSSSSSLSPSRSMTFIETISFAPPAICRLHHARYPCTVQVGWLINGWSTRFRSLRRTH